MASLIKFCKVSSQIRTNKSFYLYNIVRNSANRDYAPGPYPETEEEKAKAAEKYYLSREEYEPMPDDGHAIGDYPNLKLESGDSKDDFYPWDYPGLKRNFHEPLHIHANIIGEDRWNCSERLRYPMYVYWLCFLGTMAGMAVLFWTGERFKYPAPLTQKQYPTAGKQHYTFEALN